MILRMPVQNWSKLCISGSCGRGRCSVTWRGGAGAASTHPLPPAQHPSVPSLRQRGLSQSQTTQQPGQQQLHHPTLAPGHTSSSSSPSSQLVSSSSCWPAAAACAGLASSQLRAAGHGGRGGRQQSAGRARAGLSFRDAGASRSPIVTSIYIIFDNVGLPT